MVSLPFCYSSFLRKAGIQGDDERFALDLPLLSLSKEAGVTRDDTALKRLRRPRARRGDLPLRSGPASNSTARECSPICGGWRRRIGALAIKLDRQLRQFLSRPRSTVGGIDKPAGIEMRIDEQIIDCSDRPRRECRRSRSASRSRHGSIYPRSRRPRERATSLAAHPDPHSSRAVDRRRDRGARTRRKKRSQRLSLVAAMKKLMPVGARKRP